MAATIGITIAIAIGMIGTSTVAATATAAAMTTGFGTMAAIMASQRSAVLAAVVTATTEATTTGFGTMVAIMASQRLAVPAALAAVATATTEAMTTGFGTMVAIMALQRSAEPAVAEARMDLAARAASRIIAMTTARATVVEHSHRQPRWVAAARLRALEDLARAGRVEPAEGRTAIITMAAALAHPARPVRVEAVPARQAQRRQERADRRAAPAVAAREAAIPGTITIVRTSAAVTERIVHSRKCSSSALFAKFSGLGVCAPGPFLLTMMC
jgi:nitroreductase